MNTFDLEIVSHTRTLYNGSALSISFLAQSGSRTIEAKHESFIGILRENSVVHWKTAAGHPEEVQIKTGMLSFQENTCTVIIRN